MLELSAYDLTLSYQCRVTLGLTFVDSQSATSKGAPNKVFGQGPARELCSERLRENCDFK